jgi:hypothetical protein
MPWMKAALNLAEINRLVQRPSGLVQDVGALHNMYSPVSVSTETSEQAAP